MGGWLLCERCGGTSSTGSARGLLSKPCRGYTAVGSRGRTKCLLGGQLPKADGKVWPDGRSDAVRNVFSVLRTNGAWAVAGST